MYYNINALMEKFAETMWGTPLLVLLIGGGLFFTIYCFHQSCQQPPTTSVI